MSELLIRIKKNHDGTAALTCMRADGSTTWQRQGSHLAQFFAYHDLTHYAVETTLGHRRGFYGLVAEGWDISDFGTPWPRGPIPADADPSELIVGFLDGERTSGREWSVEEFNTASAQFYAAHDATGCCELTESELARIRAVARELFARWEELPAGEVLELPFDRHGPPL
jgi:hypothetical protein